jgi:hypothetical protein
MSPGGTRQQQQQQQQNANTALESCQPDKQTQPLSMYTPLSSSKHLCCQGIPASRCWLRSLWTLQHLQHYLFPVATPAFHGVATTNSWQQQQQQQAVTAAGSTAAC